MAAPLIMVLKSLTVFNFLILFFIFIFFFRFFFIKFVSKCKICHDLPPQIHSSSNLCFPLRNVTAVCLLLYRNECIASFITENLEYIDFTYFSVSG